MKKVWILICIACLLALAILPASATADGLYDFSVNDRAGLMTTEEEQAFDRTAVDFRHATGCRLVLYTYRSSDQNETMLGGEFFEIWGVPEKADILLLFVKDTGSEYFFEFYGYGKAYRGLTDDESWELSRVIEVYKNLKTGKIAEGSAAFARNAERLLLNSTARKNPYLKALPVAAVIGVVIGVIVLLCVRSAYTMKKRSVDYPLEHYARLELTESADTFAGSFVTRRVISSNSGSRSGGGGGRSSGSSRSGGRLGGG